MDFVLPQNHRKWQAQPHLPFSCRARLSLEVTKWGSFPTPHRLSCPSASLGKVQNSNLGIPGVPLTLQALGMVAKNSCFLQPAYLKMNRTKKQQQQPKKGLANNSDVNANRFMSKTDSSQAEHRARQCRGTPLLALGNGIVAAFWARLKTQTSLGTLFLQYYSKKEECKEPSPTLAQTCLKQPNSPWPPLARDTLGVFFPPNTGHRS